MNSFQGHGFFARAGVVNADLIVRRAKQLQAVGAEKGASVKSTAVAALDAENFAKNIHFPNLHGSARDRDQTFPIRSKSDGANAIALLFREPNDIAGHGIPKSYRAVPAGCGQQLVVRAEDYRENAFSVS